MLQYLTPVAFFAVWAAMFYFWPTKRLVLLYRCVAPPSLLASVVSLVGVGTVIGHPIFSFAAGAIIYVTLLGIKWWPSESDSSGDSHLRGPKIKDTKEVAKLTKNQDLGGIVLGGVPIPKDLENLHFLIIGTTGAGKSVAVKTMLDTLRDRGDKAVLADSGGEFLARYARPGDAIINPFDERCANWSPLAEMVGPWDANAIAASLIPEGGKDSEKEWNRYGQQFLSGVLLRLWEQGGTNGDLVRLATITPLDDLRDLLDGLPAVALLAKHNEKMFASVRGIVGSRLGMFPYLSAEAGKDGFSIRKFITEPGKGWLFLTYREDQQSALVPLVGSLLDVAATSVLSLSTDESRRVWLVADELDSLGSVNSLMPFLTKARKKGGAAVLGIQAIAQLRDRYGPDAAPTLANCCHTLLALKSGDPETAEAVSKRIGEQEVQRITSGGGDGGKNWSEQITTSRVVMAGEIQTLETNTGFLKITGPIPACHIRLALPQRLPNVAQPFVSRKIEVPAPKQPPATELAALAPADSVSQETKPSASESLAAEVFGDLFEKR